MNPKSAQRALYVYFELAHTYSGYMLFMHLFASVGYTKGKDLFLSADKKGNFHKRVLVKKFKSL